MIRQNHSAGAPTGRTVLNNTAILSVYYVLESGLLITLTLLLARYLGVAEFGRLSFALSYGLILYVISDPGISLSITKFVARAPEASNRWLSQGFSLRLWMVLGTLAVGLLPMAFSEYFRANLFLLAAIVLSEQIRGITLTYCALFRGFQVMAFEALVLAVERVPLLVSVYVLLSKGSTAEVIGLAFLGTRALSLLVAAATFRLRVGKLRLSVRPQMVRELFREALPLGVLMAAERINLYFAPLALTLTTGAYAAGLFQSAFKIVSFPIMLCGVVGGSLYPAMSASFQQQERTKKLYRYGIRMLWHLLMPCGVLTLLFAPQVIRIIYGAQYGAAAPLLQLLTPFYLLAGVITVSYYLMPAINHQKVAMNLSIASITLNLGVGIPMMLWLGPQGAAITLLFTSGVIAASYWWRASGLGYHILRLRRDIYQWGGFLATLAVLVFIRQHFSVHTWLDLLLIGTVIFAVYGTVLMATRNLLPEERQLLSSLKSRILR